MHESLKNLTLEGLGGGAVLERFTYELERLLKNIDDPNTKPDATRTITIKLHFKASEDRSSAVIAVETASKLAPIRPRAFGVMLQNVRGQLVAMEPNSIAEPLPGVLKGDFHAQ